MLVFSHSNINNKSRYYVNVCTPSSSISSASLSREGFPNSSKEQTPYENIKATLLSKKISTPLRQPESMDVIDFFRYQLDPADSFYQYARPGCLYTSYSGLTVVWLLRSEC